jgi:hypothetical protein
MQMTTGLQARDTQCACLPLSASGPTHPLQVTSDHFTGWEGDAEGCFPNMQVLAAAWVNWHAGCCVIRSSTMARLHVGAPTFWLSIQPDPLINPM